MSSHLIRSDLIPIVGGYLIVMAVLGCGLVVQRRRAAAGQSMARATRRRDQGWQPFIRHVLADALGGYLLLAAVVVGYYYGVARVGGSFLGSEFSGSALLLAVSLPVFAAGTLVVWRRRRADRRARPERTAGQGRPPPPGDESAPPAQ